MANKTKTKKEKLPIDTNFRDFSNYFEKQLSDKDKEIDILTKRVEKFQKETANKSVLDTNKKLREQRNLLEAKLLKIKAVIDAITIEQINEPITLEEQQNNTQETPN